MDRESRVMSVAIAISLFLHLVVIGTKFSFPDVNLFDTQPMLDIVLVNSKSKTKPFFADAVAQSNLDGGGNTDKKRRAKTPLPALKKSVEGDSLAQAQARQQQLEAETQQLLAQLRSKEGMLPESKKSPNDAPPQPVTGSDVATTALAIAKLEAEIARQMQDYQQRPKKAFVGARAIEYRFAQYAEDWRVRIERVGNINYPEAARGRKSSSLQLTVEIRANGTVSKMHVERSSGVRAIDQAAMKIVRLASPFPAFPPALRDTDILVITRTWTFGPNDQVNTE